jgi:hypothetical protein
MPIDSPQVLAQKIYIAYFGRPADPSGLFNMTRSFSNFDSPTSIRELLAAAPYRASIRSMFDNFGNSDESKELYPGDARQFVSAIYLNVLGRQADEEGLAFWAGEIDSGRLTRAEGALNIMAGAEENYSSQGLRDAAQLAKRVEAANYCSTELNKGDGYSVYSGNTAAAVGREFLNGITASTSAAAYQAAVSALIKELHDIPTYMRLTFADDTGTPWDEITSLSQGLRITGLSTPGRTVLLYDGDNPVPIGKVVPNGIVEWQIKVNLAEGRHVLTARSVDAQNNPTRASDPLVIIVDTVAPPAPTQMVVVPAAADGVVSAAEVAGLLVVADLRHGPAVAGDTLMLYIDNLTSLYADPIVLTAADIARGNVTFRTRGNSEFKLLSEGIHTLTTRITDGAGNIGPKGAATPVNYDLWGPTVGTVTLQDSARDGINAQEKPGGVQVTVAFKSADAIAGNLLRLSLHHNDKSHDIVYEHVLTASDVKAGQLSYTFTPAMLGKDSYKWIGAALRDAAGNVGSEVETPQFLMMTTVLTAPAIAPVVPAMADGSIRPSERSPGILVHVDVSGTGAGATHRVELLLNGKPFARPVTKSVGTTDYTGQTPNSVVTFSVDSYAGLPTINSASLSARVYDSVGNTSGAGAATIVKFINWDLVLSSSAIVPSLHVERGINAVEYPADILLRIDLGPSHAAAGDTISITKTSGAPFSTAIGRTLTVADIAATTVTFNLGPPSKWASEGANTFQVKLSDSFGNTSSVSTSIYVDTGIPGALLAPPNVVLPAQTGSFVPLHFNLGMSGARGGDSIEVFVDGQSVKDLARESVEVEAGPNFDMTILVATTSPKWLTNSSIVISARVIDFAGNVGPISGAYTVTIDTIAPIRDTGRAIVYTDVNRDGKINAGDTFLLTFSEPVRPTSTTLANMSSDHGHQLGNGAYLSQGSNANQILLSLGAGATVTSGDTIAVLVGIQDLAGNTGNFSWTIA